MKRIRHTVRTVPICWCVARAPLCSHPSFRDSQYILYATPREHEHFCENKDGTTFSKLCGAIRIQELYPGYWKQEWTRTSYLTQYWNLINHTEQITTYRLVSKDKSDVKGVLSLQLSYVCRQVYIEASYVFYSHDCFYFDTIESLIPFPHDRPWHILKNLTSISIPVSYGVQLDEDGIEWIPRHCNISDLYFANVCLCLCTDVELLANVKQLDLRM